MNLRDITGADLPILFEHQREPEANRMAGFPPRDLQAFLTHWQVKVLGNPDVEKKAIAIKGQVVGHVVSWQQNGKRLVGYWIGKHFWGQGIATSALEEFLAVHEKTRPIYAYVAVANIGSIRVAAKCGFQNVSGPTTGPDGVDELLMELGSG